MFKISCHIKKLRGKVPIVFIPDRHRKGAEQMKLDSRQIQKLAEEYKRIPLCREIYADLLTPIGVLLSLIHI